MRRDLYEPDHEAFREVVQAYVKREVTPNQQRWEQEHIVDRQAWLAAGKQAIIGHLIPEQFGGLGTQDFRFRCVVMEEFATVGATSLSSGFGLQDDIAVPYLVDLGTEEQQARWLPPMAAGECIGPTRRAEAAPGGRAASAAAEARGPPPPQAATCRASAPPRSGTATAGCSTAPRRSSPT